MLSNAKQNHMSSEFRETVKATAALLFSFPYFDLLKP